MRWFVLLFLLVLAGCKQIEYVSVPSTERDSIYITKIEKDSILVKDSVFVKSKNDTIFVERWKVEYRSKILADTLYIEKVDSVSVPYPVEVEKPYVPTYIKWLAIFGAICAGVLTLKIFRKI